MKNYVLFFTDLALLLIAAKLSFVLSGKELSLNSNIFIGFLTICFVCQLFLLLNSLYRVEERTFFGKLFISLAASFFFIQIIFLSFPEISLEKPLFEYTMVLTFSLLSAWRMFFIHTLSKVNLAKKIVIVGTGTNARLIAKELKKRKTKYELIGFAGNFFGSKSTFMGEKILGKKEEIADIVRKHHIDKLVVASEQRRDIFPINALLTCKFSGVKIYEVHDFYEKVTGKILVRDLRPSWLIFSSGFKQNVFNKTLKRTLDITLTLTALIPAFPLATLTALIVKLDDPKGPVLFSQERVGKNNELFTLYKFRSMKVDAESASGPVWAEKKDLRVTRVGEFIRKTRLDELPQLINVLKGEMSLVGPRPERLFFIKQLKEKIPYYEQRHTVKPGVTGWAAVKFRYGSSVEDALEKMQYDLYYIKNISFILDIKVLFLTIYVMLSKQGSR